MEYVSTRGRTQPIPSKKAILRGLAEDEGLYVPSSIPPLGPRLFEQDPDRSYAGRAVKILQAFLTDYHREELLSACRSAYGSNFDSPFTAPVQWLGEHTAVLELWHGPTLAFKDIALQLMPRLLSLALRDEEEPYEVVILVATSGDTGKAALEGFADVEGVRIFIFYPHEGVSAIQRLQMVTQRGRNVGAWAVRGNFDDAQFGVKQIFADGATRAKLARRHFRLSSANSINWGRLVPQIVYYFTAYEEMVLAGRIRRGQPILICVPTGNFGNILAAYYAVRCGLPATRLLCASNRNKVLADFIRTGVYDRRRDFFKTESPSMDILISSNLERLLFELSDREGPAIRDWMAKLAGQGRYEVPSAVHEKLQALFSGGFADQQETLQAIREAFSRYQTLLDPHTAVGYSVLEKYRQETGDSTPALLTATASPFKFNRAVLEALGKDVSRSDEFALLRELSAIIGQPVPPKLAELQSLPEIYSGVCPKEDMARVLFQFLGAE